MTTLAIDLPEDAATRFRAAAAHCQGIGAFLIDAATEVANADAVVDLDVVQALRSGFDDIDAGRSLSLAAANLRFEQDLAAARERPRANEYTHGGTMRA